MRYDDINNIATEGCLFVAMMFRQMVKTCIFFNFA